MQKRRLTSYLSLFALLMPSCGRPEVQAPPSAAAPIAVVTDVVARRPFAVTYRASGTVRGRNTATLTSKSVGFVRSVSVRAGDLVRVGQPLAELEASDVRAGVARARATLSSALASKLEAESAVQAASVGEKLAKTSLARASELLGQKAIAQAEYDDAEARSRSATAQAQMAHARLDVMTSGIEQAKAELAETTALLGYSKIIAPFSGRVLERYVDPGALASPGTPLLLLADDGSQRVEAAIPESRTLDLKVGGPASVEFDGARTPVAGTVSEIVPSVDSASRAFLVKIDLPPDVSQLSPGTFARVAFPVGSEERLVVPMTAISRFGALDRVFVVEGGRAHLRMITVGESEPPWTTVLSGLSVGERVVREPVAGLRDESRVEVER